MKGSLFVLLVKTREDDDDYCLKIKINLNYIERFSSCRAANFFRLNYNTHTVEYVWN